VRVVVLERVEPGNDGHIGHFKELANNLTLSGDQARIPAQIMDHARYPARAERPEGARQPKLGKAGRALAQQAVNRERVSRLYPAHALGLVIGCSFQ